MLSGLMQGLCAEQRRVEASPPPGTPTMAPMVLAAAVVAIMLVVLSEIHRLRRAVAAMLPEPLGEAATTDGA